MYCLQNAEVSFRLDEISGQPHSLTRKDTVIPLEGFGFDFGRDEKMAAGLLEYESMLEFRTWVLPGICPTGRSFSLRPDKIEQDKDHLTVSYTVADTQADVRYSLSGKAVCIDLALTNTAGCPAYLNGCAFILRLPTNEVVFDFPANAPIRHFKSSELSAGEVVQSGLVCFAIHAKLKDSNLNLLFIDPIEKWGSGVYRDGNSTIFVYNAGLEMDLKPGETASVGTFYLLPACPEDGNPYLLIRDHVADLGYQPSAGGITDGVLYSCHPSGTMDSKFPLKKDLYEYAEYLPKLKEMGIDHVWLLPVFEHDAGGVYHSTDQSVIDPRYGGEGGCRYYCDKAHELGMTVLFDYVPHGPAPDFPVAAEHPEWPSKRRDGSLQEEWECVSMDYNHPGYQEYTSELVLDHVRRFGIDGSRIDCAMGGLSNWRPYPGNRPSGNSVLAGVHITEAIRNGFLRGGKPSFILPENFNPIPNYYHCTDLFYGMNLYRAFVDLEPLLKSSPEQFAELLTDYLEREAWVTPEAYHKMRFLGNHDTVSWVWQSKRAADCYGTEGAKALFALISLIDGVPMIYQGDEDPAICCHQGETLTGFFTTLFRVRKRFLPRGSNTTRYLHTGTPVMAFLRERTDAAPAQYQTEGDHSVWVLINLSETEQKLPADVSGSLLFDSCSGDDPLAPVAPYGYRILDAED